MCVHAEHEVLQHGQVGIVAAERELPGTAGKLARAVPVVRLEVAAGEQDVEPLHARIVLELAVPDAVADADGEAVVERREVAGAAVRPLRVLDNGREAIDDLVDCHAAP